MLGMSVASTTTCSGGSRVLGEFRERPTVIFNGYGDQVASLYNGMDLKKYY